MTDHMDMICNRDEKKCYGQRTFSFGKIDYNGTGRKVNLVTIEIELKLKECTNWETLEKQEMFCFSATGSIWNTKETDLLTCGQILDDIAKYIKKNELFNTIYKLWKQYHLNDLKAGTLTQEKALQAARDNGYGSKDYTDDFNYLKTIAFEYDRGYKYGSSWLCEPMQDNDVVTIQNLLSKEIL